MIILQLALAILEIAAAILDIVNNIKHK